MVLGRVSTSTIAAGIADIKAFKNDAFAYSYGMMWTLMAGGFWQGWASKNGLNVSATHSIIAGIIGFSLAFNGQSGVLWIVSDPTSIPPYKGVVPIVIAWFFAPIATGFCSASMYTITRYLVLRNEHSYERSFYMLPFFVVFCGWINIYFVFVKGAKKTFAVSSGSEWTDDKAAWVAFVIAVGLGIIAYIGTPLVRRRAVYLEDLHLQKSLAYDNYIKAQEAQELSGVDGEVMHGKAEAVEEEVPEQKISLYRATIKSVRDFFDYNGLDLRSEVSYDKSGNVIMQKEWIKDFSPEVQALQDRAEVFDSKTERVFGVLQVFSAICVMFAHGAGEVGYMAGPLATIWVVNQTGKLPKTVEAPIWVLVISAFSLVAGLATYGKTMTKAVGTEFCKLTPARGFAAELSTAVVIMVASQYGLPTSSSQCITGGIVGIGLCEGASGVNWKYFFQTFSSWIATMFVMGVGVGLLFTQGHTAP